MHQSLPRQEIIEKFTQVKKRQMLALIPVALAFVLFLASSQGIQFTLLNLRSEWLPPIGFGIVVGVLLFSLFNWRCPSCEGYLGKGMGHKFCPKCGAQLEE